MTDTQRIALGVNRTTLREQVYDYIRQTETGCIASEVTRELKRPHSSITARIRELVETGDVMDSGLRMRGDYNLPNIVWKVAPQV